MTSRIIFLLALGLASCLAVPASAQSEANDQWQFAIAPYLWTPGISGDVTAGPSLPSASIDLDIGDVLSDIDMGAMVFGEARKGRFSIIGNLFYADIAEKGSTNVGPGIFATRTLNAKASSKTFFAGLGAGYDLYQDEETLVTGFGGFRYWDVENELRVTGTNFSASSKDSANWIDPLIGLSAKRDLGSGFSLQGYGDIGGVGIGSDFTWSLMGLVSYEVTESVSASLGWRYLYVDYDDSGFLFDVSMSGPMAGIVVHF